MDDHEEGERPDPAGDLCHLFADEQPGRTLSVELPQGSLVWPDPDYLERVPARPAFWLSDEPVTGELWSRLRADHPRSGLWPLLLDDSAQPWWAGQVAPESAAEIDNYSASAFMYEVWSDMLDPLRTGPDYDLGDLSPFEGLCPGLAAPGRVMYDPDALADACARALDGGGTPLGLVAASRGADSLAVMGWQGALNHNKWTAPLAAVVRSWEERFGARIVRLGFNTMDLSVAAPPVTTRHALHVAAEHWTFCPDNVYQGPGTLEDYAEVIRGRTVWSFWWD
ncbi:DUF4253 domain-containing protein [Sinosporangium siamense]|uniref:DUF4253 domain-containing protein n=1 Tax=Sinosporangium siamense TaxID=1367973 RepID=A0A919VC84_9ACTN|nr:DUF4253 domain-containing protein [Sinosporangium siamense]GII92884.1 hypothetical protein Ssi02_31150 [Sinosporangium siamense]